MATKRRSVTKKKTKKKTKKAPAKKAPAKKAPAKKTVAGDLVDPKTLEVRPRPRRKSKFEPIVEKLLSDMTKAYIYEVPPGKSSSTYRGMLYPRITKALNVVKPGHNLRATVKILKSGNLAVQLVEKDA